MSKVVRQKILEILKAHDVTGSSNYYSDKQLAQDLGLTEKEVQDQLDILESKAQVELTKAMGPSYGAIISTQGKLYLEDD